MVPAMLTSNLLSGTDVFFASGALLALALAALSGVLLAAFTGINAVNLTYLIVAAIGVIAALVAAASVRRRRDGVPFYMVALIFATAFGTLAISFWPYMVPFSITIEEAASPHSTLAFMFWGAGVFVFPLMLLYTVISYTVFRGKVRPTADHY